MSIIDVNLVIDKSALQALSREELSWLNHFTRHVVTDVLLTEILGNLAKSWKGKRSPEEFMASLAQKARGGSTNLCLPSTLIMRLEQAGRPIELGGRPLVWSDGGRDAQGALGFIVNEPQELRDLWRWADRSFEDRDRDAASYWRSTLDNLESAKKIAALRGIRSQTMGEILTAVEDLVCRQDMQWKILTFAHRMSGQIPRARESLKRRWIREGRPAVSTFTPYSIFVMKCTILRQMAEDAGQVRRDAKNPIDGIYLHYLPFCQIFISNDKLHRCLVPTMLRKNQAFLTGDEVKKSLRDIISFYNQISDERKLKGRVDYAGFLPLEVSTPLHSAFDIVVPSWRRMALEPSPLPLSPEREAEILARFRASVARSATRRKE